MSEPLKSDSHLIDMLQEVTQTARDSEEGYRTAAEDVQDPELRAEFLDLARTRSEQADENDSFIRRMGGEPAPRGGSTSGKAHRLFVDLKSAITGNDRKSIVREVVRGESYAESVYDKAMRMSWPDDVRRALERQHRSVRDTRNHWRRMAQQYGADSGSMAESVMDGGQRSLEAVQRYVTERPMMSAIMAVGIGVVLGSLLRPSGRSRH